MGRPTTSGVPAAARVALVVNLLTEDNLPYYSATLGGIGTDGPWGEWARRWTAEEGRHAIVIRDYLMVTRAVDPVALERERMRQVSTGWAPAVRRRSPTMLVYTSLQELATRISHRNTGLLLDDPAGRAVMARVAADENLHHLFYRDLASAAIERDPSAMVVAMERVVREFAMPGTGIPDFASRARTMAKAGVYDFAIHHDQILVPVDHAAVGAHPPHRAHRRSRARPATASWPTSTGSARSPRRVEARRGEGNRSVDAA